MPVVGGDLLPFLPRVSGTYLLVFIYPFIGYADFCLSIYVRILHVILKVVVFPPRASQHQLAQSAYRWGSLYHIDTYEQVAGYTTGRAYRKFSGGWEANSSGGCGDVKEMGPSYFLRRPQQLAESSSSHLVVSGTRCLSRSGGVL